MSARHDRRLSLPQRGLEANNKTIVSDFRVRASDIDVMLAELQRQLEQLQKPMTPLIEAKITNGRRREESE
jgi:hypothetical protein